MALSEDFIPDPCPANTEKGHCRPPDLLHIRMLRDLEKQVPSLSILCLTSQVSSSATSVPLIQRKLSSKTYAKMKGSIRIH